MPNTPTLQLNPQSIPPSRLEDSIHEYRIMVLFAYALVLMCLAFVFSDPMDIWAGMLRILRHPSNLLSDYMQIGGIGAALFNTALMTFLSVVMVKVNQVPVSGAILAAIFTVSGFSLFGKNLFNTIPITIGVWLFSKFMKGEFKQQILVALYGTAISPLVSYISFAFGLPFCLGAVYGCVVGILCGFLLPPLAASFVRFHQGFSLYNVGFTAGVIGMLAIGALRFLDWEIKSQSVLYQGSSSYLAVVFYTLFVVLTITGYILDGKCIHTYKALLKSSGRIASDFVGLYGFGVTLFNMGVMGVIATTYALVVGGQLNGPIIGGILTVVGFAAFGKHPRNVIPIFMGVLTLNLYSSFDHSSTTAVIAGLFGTTLAPIAGYFGVFPGILAGFIHMTMVVNVGALHSGVNLYNNGFSGGFVAAIMVPLLEIVQQRGLLPKQLWHKWRMKKPLNKTDKRLGSGGEKSV